MKFKKIAALAVGTVMVAGLSLGMTACKEKRDPNTIYMWAGGQWLGPDYENLTAFIDWYNENDDSGVKVHIEPVPDFETTFASATASDDAPDLMIWDRFNTPTYASSKNLEPIDDLIARDGIDKTKFNATAYNELSYKGVQYGLPLDLDLWGIYINMEIVEAYNEANPSNKITCLWNEDGSDKLDWSWDDVLDMATRLKGFTYTKGTRQIEVKNGYDGRKVNEFFIHNFLSTGQDFLDANGNAQCANEYGEAVLNYLKELYKTGSAEMNDENGFIQGATALYMHPTYFASYLKVYGRSLNVRFMPQPKAPMEGGLNRGVMGGYGMAIPCPIYEEDRTEAWLDKKEKCWQFMKNWLYNPVNMRKWAEMSMTIPALTETHDSVEVTGNKVLKDVIPFAEQYTTRPGVPGWTSVQVNVFNNYVTSFCNGSSKEDVRKTLETIQKEANSALKSFGIQG